MPPRLQIELGLAGSEINRTIKEIERLNEHLSAAEKNVHLFGGSVDANKRALNTYNTVLQGLLRGGLPTWNQYVQQLKTEMSRLTAEIDQQKRTLAEQSAMDALGVKLQQIANTQALVSDTIKRSTAEIRAYQGAINALIAQGVDPADSRIRQMQTTIQGLNNTIASLQAQSSRNAFLQQLQQTGRLIPDLEQKIKNLQVALNQATDTRRITQLNIRLREAQNELTRLRNLGLEAGNAVSSGMSRATSSTRAFNNSVSSGRGVLANLTSQLRGLVATYMSLYAAIQAAGKAFNVSMRADALSTSFSFIVEDSTERLKKLLYEANRLGVGYLTLAETNKKFIAAAKASNFDMQVAEKVFTSVANAGAKLKLSNEQIGGTFLALEQMISKGTVSMEELRRQLGDRLPGAFAMAARAMGMTEVAFNKAVANGEVLSKDLLPRLADEIDKTYGRSTTEKIESLQASVNRLSNTFTELVARSNIGNAFRAFIDGINSVTRAIAGLNNSTREAADLHATLKERYASNTSQLLTLTGEYERIRQQIAQTNTGHDEMQRIINKIAEIMPTAVTEWDRYGNAIAISTLRINAMNAAQRELLATLNRDVISRAERDARGLEVTLYRAQQQMQKMADMNQDFLLERAGGPKGEDVIVTMEDLQKKIAIAKADLVELYTLIQDRGGSLSTQSRNLLAFYGLDQAGAAMREWDKIQQQAKNGIKTLDDALRAISLASTLDSLESLRTTFEEFVGNKKFEEAMRQRTSAINKSMAAAQRLQGQLEDAILQSEQRVALARTEGIENEEQRIRNWYETRLTLAKSNAAILVQLQNNMNEELRLANEKAEKKATEDGEKAREDRRKKMLEGAKRFLEENRKLDAEEAKVSINLQRRLFESRTQIALRELNTEFKERERMINEALSAEILAGVKRVDAEKKAQAELIKAQEEYYNRREQLEAQQRELNIQTAFNGSALSVPLARLDEQIKELRFNFQGLTNEEVEQFRSKIATLENERQRLQLFESTIDNISSAFGNLFSDAIFDSENALKNFGKTFQGIAKSIISELVKIGIRYALNQAIATKAMAVTTATGIATGKALAAAYAPAAAFAATASFGGAAIAGSAALTAFVGATKAMSLAGFKSGGFTGWRSPNEIAGVVHGQEYVVNAEATRKNLPLLQAINRGQDVSTSLNSPAGRLSLAPRVETVHVAVEDIKISGDMLRIVLGRAQRNNNSFNGGV